MLKQFVTSTLLRSYDHSRNGSSASAATSEVRRLVLRRAFPFLNSRCFATTAKLVKKTTPTVVENVRVVLAGRLQVPRGRSCHALGVTKVLSNLPRQSRNVPRFDRILSRQQLQDTADGGSDAWKSPRHGLDHRPR